MKFEKDVARIIVYYTNGDYEHHTYSAFRLNVEELAEEIMRIINNGKQSLNLDGIYVETGQVESFEISNYNELWELHLEREAEENEK